MPDVSVMRYCCLPEVFQGKDTESVITIYNLPRIIKPMCPYPELRKGHCLWHWLAVVLLWFRLSLQEDFLFFALFARVHGRASIVRQLVFPWKVFVASFSVRSEAVYTQSPCLHRPQQSDVPNDFRFAHLEKSWKEAPRSLHSWGRGVMATSVFVMKWLNGAFPFMCRLKRKWGNVENGHISSLQVFDSLFEWPWV